jgi:uncharacterized membrane protein
VKSVEPGSTIIKRLQNVPKADLEMLFPHNRIKMGPIDKLIIEGLVAIGDTVMLIIKLGASLILVASMMGYCLGIREQSVQISSRQLISLALCMAVFGGFVFKVWSKFKNCKLKFMKALANNLYVKNVDNNASIFHH